ncbi:hypothetical protein RQP46_002901 [Phenoliferia psychrophenolica]
MWPQFFALFPSLQTLQVDLTLETIAAVGIGAPSSLQALTFQNDWTLADQVKRISPDLLDNLLRTLRLPNLVGLRRLTFRTETYSDFAMHVPATIISLPTEILDTIFECLQSKEAKKDYEDLSPLSLVCRSWREPAQRALFTVLVMSDTRALRWLASPARTRYHVKSLSFEYSSGPRLEALVREACPRLSAASFGHSHGFIWKGGYDWCATDQAADIKSLRLTLQVDLTLETITAVGIGAPSSLQALTFQNDWTLADQVKHISPDLLDNLLRTLRLPNVVGLRRLTFRTETYSDFANKEGIALLEECEERSIAVLCRSGYL